MIRIGAYALIVAFVIYLWPIAAICAGVFMLWRLYPKG